MSNFKIYEGNGNPLLPPSDFHAFEINVTIAASHEWTLTLHPSTLNAEQEAREAASINPNLMFVPIGKTTQWSINCVLYQRTKQSGCN